MKKTISIEIYKKIEEAKNIASMYPDRSFEICEEAYIMAKENELRVEEGYALLGMSFVCRAKSDIRNMLDYSFKALEIFESEYELLGQAKSLNLIGVAFFYGAMYEESLKNFLRVMDLFEQFKDDLMLCSVLNNIGEVYRESFRYDKAIEYYNKALKISIDSNILLNQAAIFSNIGEVYFSKNDNELALEYFKRCYNIVILEKDMITLGEIENRIGNIYLVTKRFDKAEKYLYSALDRLENINNKYYVIDVLINIALLQQAKGSRESLYNLEKAMQYAENINARKKLYVLNKLFSEYYEREEYYKKALEYYKKYCLLNDEVMTSNLRNKLEILNLELQNIEETGKFEKVRKMLEREIINQKNELEKIKLANDVLEKKAFEDELTGIQNRRSLNIFINKIFEESLLNGDIVVLFMLDIDKFKKYNDYWGHAQGDECLKAITDCINKIKIRRQDVFGRYGGEEFVYITNSLSYEQAMDIGNHIRNEVEKLGLYYIIGNEKKSVTISIGGAMGRVSDFKTMVNMMEVADKELYRAKNMGRNNTKIKNLSK